jgi:hypothetical protein
MEELIKTTDAIRLIEVAGVEVVSECKGLCVPENFFECIEICKICGKTQ